jgi:hypothetical protein
MVAMLLVGGCETVDFWQPIVRVFGRQGRHHETEAPPKTTNSNPGTGVPRADCREVAKERSTDAEANGYDLETAETVYKGTYADCVAWQKKHGP